MVAAEFPAGGRAILIVTSRASTRDHAVDVAAPSARSPRARAALAHFLRPTTLIPTDDPGGAVGARLQEPRRLVVHHHEVAALPRRDPDQFQYEITAREL